MTSPKIYVQRKASLCAPFLAVDARMESWAAGGIGSREQVPFLGLGQSIQLLLGGGIIGTRDWAPFLGRGRSRAANRNVALADGPQLAGAVRLGGIELVHNIDLTPQHTTASFIATNGQAN